MISREIVEYIKNQIEKGQSKDEIRNALASAGWQQADTEEAFKYAQSGVPLAAVRGSLQNAYQTNQNSLKSPTDLLKEAWGLFKLRFPTFANIVILSAIGSGIINLFAKSTSNNPSDLSLFSNLGALVVFILFFLAIVVLQVWSQAAVFFAIKDSEENIGVKESYKRGWLKIGSFFLGGIIAMYYSIWRILVIRDTGNGFFNLV